MADEQRNRKSLRRHIIELTGGVSPDMSFKEMMTMRPAATFSETMNEEPPAGSTFTEKMEFQEVLRRSVTQEEFKKIHSGEEAGKDGITDAPPPGTSLYGRIRYYTDERIDKQVDSGKSIFNNKNKSKDKNGFSL